MDAYWDRHAGRSSPELDPAQLIFAAPLRRAAAGRRVLDCGAGAGSLSACLAPVARRLLAVDASPAMAARARTFFPDIDYRQADVLTADLGEQFDIICGIAFLHEIPHPQTPSVIAFLDRHLAPGGFCWFQENSFFNPMARFLRTHVVGRYGVPQYGSAHETPFDPERWALYRAAFRHAERSAEAFVVWERVWTYFIRRGPDAPWRSLDALCSHLPDAVKLRTSYIQHIYLSRDVPKREAFEVLF